MKANDPDQCVASRHKIFDDYEIVLRHKDGTVIEELSAPVTAERMAWLLGLKWRTVQKRRQRGSNWREALDPKLKRSAPTVR